MNSIEPSNNWNPIPLEIGKKVRLGTNRPVNFQIKTVGGSTIEGVIPANEYLIIINGGDLMSADLTIEDILKGPQEIA